MQTKRDPGSIFFAEAITLSSGRGVACRALRGTLGALSARADTQDQKPAGSRAPAGDSATSFRCRLQGEGTAPAWTFPALGVSYLFILPESRARLGPRTQLRLRLLIRALRWATGPAARNIRPPPSAPGTHGAQPGLPASHFPHPHRPPREVTPGVVPLADLLCRGTLASLNRLRLHARWGRGRGEEEEAAAEEEEMEAVEKPAVGALRLHRWLRAPLGKGEGGTRVPLVPRGSPACPPPSTVCLWEEPVWE